MTLKARKEFIERDLIHKGIKTGGGVRHIIVLSVSIERDLIHKGIKTGASHLAA